MENPAPKKLGTYTSSGHLPRTSIIKAHAHDGYEEYGGTGYVKNYVKREDNITASRRYHRTSCARKRGLDEERTAVRQGQGKHPVQYENERKSQ